MKTTYRKPCAPNLLVGSDLTLDPSFKVIFWSLIPLMVYISLIIGRRGFGCEDESFGGVTFDIIFCMSLFNHVPSGDTLRRDAISSLNRILIIYLFVYRINSCGIGRWLLHFLLLIAQQPLADSLQIRQIYEVQGGTAIRP